MSDVTRRILTGLSVGALVAGIFAALQWGGRLDTWEAKTYDWRVSTVAHFDPKDSRVVMFYVDQASLDFMKGNAIGWPWPRALYADVLRFCKVGGARAVIFDIIYSEDSVYGAADDAAFAEGLAEAGNGFLAVFLSSKSGASIEKKQPHSGVEGGISSDSANSTSLRRAPAKLGLDTALPDGGATLAPIIDRSAVAVTGGGVPITDYPGFMALPIPPLRDAARGFGNVQLAPDGDGIYRRMPLIFGYQDRVFPSLYIGMLHAERPDEVVQLAFRELRFGDTRIPLDLHGNLILKYYGGVDTFPSYGLARVLTSAQELKEGQKPELDPSIVKDKVVIVGVSAPGLYDLRSQPLASRYPGAEIHATAFQNILSGDFMRMVSLGTGLAGIILLAMVLGIALRLELPTAVGMGVAGLALGVAVGVPFALIRYGWWIPMVAPIGAVAGTFAAVMVVNFLSEGKKKRMIRNTFQKYLAPDVVKSLLKNPEAIALGGAEQTLTVYFSDIAGFTGISENISAAELVAALNEYLTRCTNIIIDEHGTVDKYIGDAVMAFWGAPLPMANHAEQACIAALRVQKMLAAWNAERARLGQSPLATRIGIHTGSCVVGNMGSTQRMNYTVMGDTVNLASRLEGLNKFFGTSTIVSGDCVAGLRDTFLCRHLAAVRVKGRGGAVEIYELRNEMSVASDKERQFVAQFEKGLDAYRVGRLPEAKEVFESLAQNFGDVSSKRYVQWINAAARAPIGSDWDGVVTFDSK